MHRIIERLLLVGGYALPLVLGALVALAVLKLHFGRRKEPLKSGLALQISAAFGFVVSFVAYLHFPIALAVSAALVFGFTVRAISRRSWVAFGIVFVGIWACYGGLWPLKDKATAITNRFAYDDKDLLTGNDFLVEWMGGAQTLQGENRNHIADAMTRDFAQLAQKAAGAPGLNPINYFRPVIALAYMSDTYFWSEVPRWDEFEAAGKKRIDLKWEVLNPLGFHFTNVLVHALNALLVFVLLRAMTRRYWFAVVAGFLFAIHPIHSESVTWIAGRTDLIGTTFFLLTFWCYLRFRDHGRVGALVASFAFYLVGIFAKEMIAALPIVIVLYEGVRLIASHRGRTPDLHAPQREPHPPILAFTVWIAYFLLTVPYFLAKGTSGPRPPQADTWYNPLIADIYPVTVRFFGFMSAIYWYAWKSFFPTNLNIYPWVDFVSTGQGLALMLGHVAIVLLAIAAVWFWRAGRFLGFAVLAFYASLAPLSCVPSGAKLLRFAEDVDFPVSERFVYIPSLFACVAIAWIVARLLPRLLDARKRPLEGAERSAETSLDVGIGTAMGAAVVLGVTVLWVGKVQGRHDDWYNDFKLFESGVRTSPYSVRMANNYGFELMQRWRIKEARRMLRRCTELVISRKGRAPMPVAFQNLGHSYYLQGEFATAVQYYRRSFSIEPTNAISANNLGALMGIFGSITMNINYIQEGYQYYQQAVRIAPNYVFAKSSVDFMGRVYRTWDAYLRQGSRHPRIVWSFGNSFLFAAKSISQSDDPKYLQAMMILDSGLRHMPSDAEMIGIMGAKGEKIQLPAEIDPEIQAAGPAGLNNVMRSLFEKCFTNALGKFEALLDEWGEENPALNFMMAEALRLHWRSSGDAGERDRAIKHYRLTRDREAEHGGAARGLAELLRSKGDVEDAIQIVDRTVDQLLIPRLPWDGAPPAVPESEPRTAMELGAEVLRRIEELRKRGEIDDAEFARWKELRDRTFRKAIDFQRKYCEERDGGTNGEEWNKLGYFHVVVFETIGDRTWLEKALPLFDKAMALAPKRADAAINKMTMLRRLGRNAEAEQLRRKKMLEFPRHPQFQPPRPQMPPGRGKGGVPITVPQGRPFQGPRMPGGRR